MKLRRDKVALNDSGTTVNTEERRSETRKEIEKYHSAEFRIHETGCLYQSKIWNISSKGMCLIVKENSEIISKLEIGKVLDMKYYPDDLSQKPAILKTQIIHITLENQGRFKNHYLMGLVILSENGLPISTPPR
jgi:hypothetical protein